MANPGIKSLEISGASCLKRDVLNESFDNIQVDDKKMYEEIKTYIRHIAPDKEKIVKLYNGKAKIFEAFGVEKQIKSAFGQTVSLKGGGYLIIEHTEALTCHRCEQWQQIQPRRKSGDHSTVCQPGGGKGNCEAT